MPPVLAAAALAISHACSSEAGARSRWVSETDTIGDTIVVRTVAGGEWGSPATLVTDVAIGKLEGEDEYLLGRISGLAVDAGGNMYIYDSQVPALRKYDPAGTYLMTIGRKGGGPGEYNNSDGGMAILPGGRLLLRDPGNARFQLWTLDGEPTGHWPYVGGFFTSTPVFVDTAGHVYSTSVDFSSPPPWKNRLVRYSPEGQPMDTIDVPDWDYEPPQISAQRIQGQNRSMSVNNVPYSPTEQWTLSSLGYFVGAVTARYAVDLFRPDRVLRLERVVEPVGVQPDEKQNAEDVAADNMRRTQPDWKWNGPAIPDVKPPFTTLLVAQDGRIWVQLSQPGERIPDEELPEDPTKVRPDGTRVVQRTWREPVVFDVFEPDGRYIGLVRAPLGLSMYPRPIIRGDTMWAVVRDELDVQQLTRLHVQVETTRQ